MVSSFTILVEAGFLICKSIISETEEQYVADVRCIHI